MKNYRVWDSVTEIMYYPEDFKLVIDHGEPELHLQRKLGVVVAKENDIGKSAYLMQSTGLKDKNGVEIYEGDIVETPSSKDKYLVDYVEGGFVGRIKYREYTTLYKGLKVIGNIYENPELLEEEE